MTLNSDSGSAKRVKFKFYTMVILGIFGIVLFSGIVYSGFTERTTQLSAYSDRWNDMSRFRESVDELGFTTASIISSPTMLLDVDDPKNTLFVAVGIERAYTATEARAIYDFVRSGGKAIIADDYGYANSVSEFYFSVTFLEHRLWDQVYDKNPQLVMVDIDSTGNFNFDGNILLNNPTAMLANSGVIATSTNLSWVDMNDDGVQNIDELPQPYPVAVKKLYDDGQIVFISDPGPFINDMWERRQNSEFIIALVTDMLDSGGTVVFDESRHIRESPLEGSRQALYEALVIITTDDQLRWLAAILTVLIMGLLIIAYDYPQELFHRFNVAKFKITELNEPNLTPKDTDRLRYVFLERVRIHLGLSVDEFRELTRDELEELIGDRRLSSFALELKKIYFASELSEMFTRISAWPNPAGSSIEPTPPGYETTDRYGDDEYDDYYDY